MRKPDIHDGRAFALVSIMLAYVWLVYIGRIEPKSVDTYMGVAFGFLFAQGGRRDPQ